MDLYSRIVTYLKVGLPLVALALLSTLFLVSERVTPGGTLPFSPKEIETRLTDQQVTAPNFTGSTDSGDEIFITAEKAQPGLAGTAARAEVVQGEFHLVGGTHILLLSDEVYVRLQQDTAQFQGNVRIQTSTDLQMVTDRLDTALNRLQIEAPTEVRAKAPFGDLTSGAMEITEIEPGGPSQILFTKGVKVIYDPRTVER